MNANSATCANVPTPDPGFPASARELRVLSMPGIGEIDAGDDLVSTIGEAIAETVRDGDIIVVTSKVVSKAEGRFAAADDREDAIARETVRIVAEKHWLGGSTRIVENRLGLIQAAAGVDASNTPEGTILLLPEDPDATAQALCTALRSRFEARLAVVITDTMGRPWRLGQTDVAIGSAGLRVLDDLKGVSDNFGRELQVTSAAIADEIAGAANLLAGKITRCPVTIVRGIGEFVLDSIEAAQPNSRARDLLRPVIDDLFHTGAREAYEQGRAAGRAEAYDEQRTETNR